MTTLKEKTFTKEEALKKDFDYTDVEIRKALIENESLPKPAAAVIECRFDPQFLFLDNRGKVAEKIKESFPKEGDQKYEFQISDNEFIMKEPSTKSISFCGVSRAAFTREMMVPTTLDFFGEKAREQLSAYQEVFPDIKTLNRTGIRIQQVNRIEDKKSKDLRYKFLNHLINSSRFFTVVRSKDTETVCKEATSTFIISETLTRGSKVFSYKVRIIIGIGSGATANSTFDLQQTSLKHDMSCIFTDIDFYKEDCTWSDAETLTKVAIERAEVMHLDILGEILGAR